MICDHETSTYRVGYKIMQLGLSVLSRTTVKIVSERFLTDLRDTTGETVGLSIRVGNEPMFVEEVQSNRGLRYITPLGMRFPLWHGSIGKVILANMKPEEVTAILNELKQSKELRLPSGQLVDIESLRQELIKIKKEGYAVSIGELEPGTSAVAAAIFNRNNEVMGAISIVGPSERFTDEILEKYCKLVNSSAQKITQQIGTVPAVHSIKMK